MSKTILKVLIVLAGVLVHTQAAFLVLIGGTSSTPVVNITLDENCTKIAAELLPQLQAFCLTNVPCYTWGMFGRYFGPVTVLSQKALLSRYGCVLYIDWEREAQGGLTGAIGSQINLQTIAYPEAMSKIPQIADQVAKVFTALKEYTYDFFKRLFLIGFSLGAHLVGEVGRRFKVLNGCPVPRIIAMEPSKYVNDYTFVKSVDPSCADHVLGIHTNGGVYSLDTAVGHADCWLNPATAPTQPNCDPNQPIELGFDDKKLCSHNRAPICYFESVQNHTIICFGAASKEAFLAGQLTGENFALEDITSTPKGNFYANTNGVPTYGRGSAGSHL